MYSGDVTTHTDSLAAKYLTSYRSFNMLADEHFGNDVYGFVRTLGQQESVISIVHSVAVSGLKRNRHMLSANL